jgi:Amt family ammonium transporter
MKRISLIFFLFFCISSAFAESIKSEAVVQVNHANTSWLLISAALVMLMTPALGFFYGGMVSNKNTVSTILLNFVSLAIVGIIWVTVGYSLVFSEGNGIIGGSSLFLLKDSINKIYGFAEVPLIAFVIFQMMFACITPAIITGSVAGRVDFKAWLLFLTLWSLFVYIPVAHWVWGPDGWIGKLGCLDFAGGLVVHVISGVAGLVAAFVTGKRTSKTVYGTNDVSLVSLGAALLWFGWFGFNAGSAISSGKIAAHAFLVTFIAGAVALIFWMLTDWVKSGKPSATGASIGLIVGLVSITPCAGFVSLESAIIISATTSILSNLLTRYMKKMSNIDDTLDVFACHGFSGIMGTIMVGLFASKEINPGIVHEGLFISGKYDLLIANLSGTVIVAIYSAIITYILIKLVNFITPIRVSSLEEEIGLDYTTHGEISRGR